MRFANLAYLAYEEQTPYVGIGDYIQLQAIDGLYEYMGISSEEIVRIGNDELASYVGEPLILPINQLIAARDYCDEYGNFKFSKDIIPVFLGVSLRKGFFEFTEYNVNYLKRHEPVGCRDYFTYKSLVERGIVAYISGCLTITLPKRAEGNYKKIYLVDCPSEVRKYIPKKDGFSYEVKRQLISVDNENRKKRDFSRKLTKQIFDEYRDNAALVVTSRLHCAVPCIAMGIPVIVAKQYKGYTFDWLERFVPIYTEDNYEEIDWDIKAVEIEDYKKMALECAAKRIRQTYDRYSYIECNLNNFYLKGYSEDYEVQEMGISGFKKRMENRYSEDEEFKYALWGTTEIAEKVYDYISDHFKKAKLVRVIDTYKRITFKGLVTEVPEVINKNDDFLIVVTTTHCVESGAKPLFEKLQKPEEQYIYVPDILLEEL